MNLLKVNQFNRKYVCIHGLRILIQYLEGNPENNHILQYRNGIKRFPPHLLDYSNYLVTLRSGCHAAAIPSRAEAMHYPWEYIHGRTRVESENYFTYELSLFFLKNLAMLTLTRM
jgi:hypothetical protein